MRERETETETESTHSTDRPSLLLLLCVSLFVKTQTWVGSQPQRLNFNLCLFNSGEERRRRRAQKKSERRREVTALLHSNQNQTKPNQTNHCLLNWA